MAMSINLETALSPENRKGYYAKHLRDVTQAIVGSKRIVCMTGAGISTTAGIPDFRSKDGLYELAGNFPSSSSHSTSSTSSSSSKTRSPSRSPPSSQSLKGADLFSSQVFQSAATATQFYRFMSALHELSSAATPTPTHRFLNTLSKKNKLLRLYTQNIDGLEEKAGLKSVSQVDALAATFPAPSSSGSKGKGKAVSTTKKQKIQGDIVHLHGRASLVRCTVCKYTGLWDPSISEAYNDGYSVECGDCLKRKRERVLLGKRSTVAVGTLRPAITLYGEAGMEEVFISEVQNADMRSKPDCLIVFGTSLKVDGFKRMVKDFASQVQEDQDGKVIYVNIGAPTREWETVFDYHIDATTDAFVNHILGEWKRMRPEEFKSQTLLSTALSAPTIKSTTSAAAAKKPVKDKKVLQEKDANVVKPTVIVKAFPSFKKTASPMRAEVVIPVPAKRPRLIRSTSAESSMSNEENKDRASGSSRKRARAAMGDGDSVPETSDEEDSSDEEEDMVVVASPKPYSRKTPSKKEAGRKRHESGRKRRRSESPATEEDELPLTPTHSKNLRNAVSEPKLLEREKFLNAKVARGSGMARKILHTS